MAGALCQVCTSLQRHLHQCDVAGGGARQAALIRPRWHCVRRGSRDYVRTNSLARLLGMMGSAHDGEALKAARIADRLVRDAGCTWFDVEVFGFVLALTAFSTNALAQNNITVLTPTTDSCLSYTRAIEANDFMLTEGVNGWALGYLSGVAQATGIDILRDAAAPDLFRQLYSVCKAEPRQLLSAALEGIARNLIAAKRH